MRQNTWLVNEGTVYLSTLIKSESVDTNQGVNPRTAGGMECTESIKAHHI